MANSPFLSTYTNWIQGQESGLSDLLHAKNSPLLPDQDLRALVNRTIQQYEDYSQIRHRLAGEGASPTFFSPPWCTSFEKSVMFIGGCRPSLFIRLLYSLSGESLESHLADLLAGRVGLEGDGGIMALSARQLRRVNELHCRVLREEEKLTATLATLQEDVADKPLLPIVREKGRRGEESTSSGGGGGGGIDGEVEKAFESYEKGLGELLWEADKLRVAAARELVEEVLTPRQAVELLVAAKQLHLSVHDWGTSRDCQRNHG